MSILMQLKTGLSEREWEDLWARLVRSPRFQTEALIIGFEEWRQAVIDEGENRRFITYATTGKRIGLRKGIAQVVAELRHDVAEGMIHGSPGPNTS
jgi:hypothetical protein